MLKVVYYSLTGNTRRFLSRTGYDNISEIKKDNKLIIDEPFILLTGTVGFGEVPGPVERFLNKDNNADYLRGVISSGNRNWGPNFAKAGDVISEQYHVPLLMKIELHGKQSDTDLFNERMQQIEKY